MNEAYTFIVLATTNTKFGLIELGDRFTQLFDTFASIRGKVPGAVIVFIDNSLTPLSDDQVAQIREKVDVFEQFNHNIFSRFANQISSKGLGEACMMDRALELIKERNLITRRVFKITGRYRLTDTFDIDEYSNPEMVGKYTFKVNQWDVSVDSWKTRQRVVYFETRLWSICSTLYEEYRRQLQIVFNIMVSNIGEPMCNYEIAHWQSVPYDKVYEMEKVHVEGITADTGVYKLE